MTTRDTAAADAIRAERHFDAGVGAGPAAVAAPEPTGPIASHLLAYAELVSALLQSWQRVMARRALGAVLALVGIGVSLAMLTIGAVAAAWPTSHRWTVLLLVAGAYLAMGLFGVSMTRKRAAPSPTTVLLAELRQDAELVSTAFRQRSR